MTAQDESAIVMDCGQEQLVGIVHRAAVPAGDRGVLVVVGGPQYRVGSHRQFTLMARALASAGVPVMRFDYRSMGDSDGDRQDFTVTASDIEVAIAAFQRSVPGVRRVVLWGLCDGASAILLHGCSDPQVAALILANPWVQTESREAQAYIRHYYWRRILQGSFWRKLLKLQINLRTSAGDWWRKARRATSAGRHEDFVDRMRLGLERFGGPVLILLSENDLVARQFADLCRDSPVWRAAVARDNVSVQHLAGADHTFSGKAALSAATTACLDWLQRTEAQACH
jgi:exosortase A-associated hydrolase 1